MDNAVDLRQACCSFQTRLSARIFALVQLLICLCGECSWNRHYVHKWSTKVKIAAHAQKKRSAPAVPRASTLKNSNFHINTFQNKLLRNFSLSNTTSNIYSTAQPQQYYQNYNHNITLYYNCTISINCIRIKLFPVPLYNR